MKRITAIITDLLLAVLLLAGCTATQVTSFWKDPNYQKQPHKILAVAILKNKANRIALEDEFARQLNQKGLDVTTGHKMFPEYTPANKNELEKFLRDNGFDTFLLVRVVGEKELRTVIPDTASAAWPGSYNTGYSVITSPGYVVEQRLAMAEAELFDVGSEKRFWKAASETMVNAVDHELIADYVKQIVNQMQRSGLLP
jgi:hypothetical protein